MRGADHEYPVRRALCDAVPIEELRMAPAELASRVVDVQERLRLGDPG